MFVRACVKSRWPFKFFPTISSSSSELCFVPLVQSRRGLSSKTTKHDAGANKTLVASPYVSKHFCLQGDEVAQYLEQRGFSFRLQKDVAVVETCPFCHDTRGLPDNQYKLNIYRDSGGFNCFRCHAKGSWYEFRNYMSHGEKVVEPLKPIGSSVRPGKPVEVISYPSSEEQRKRVSKLWSSRFSSVRQYLCEQRGLSEETLRKFGVGASRKRISIDSGWREDDCMTFPMYDGEGRLVRYKIRSVFTKTGMSLQPKGGKWGLFGLNTVPQDATEVILTEGELDAMSVWQATGRPTVSLPNGAASLPVDLLPALERFQRVILWMDTDEAGQAGAKQFARKLGMKRCLVVHGINSQGSDAKDANDWLRQGLDLNSALSKASVIAHDGVMRFDDMRESVYDYIVNGGSKRGVQCQSFPRLNSLLKGHRRGELTIVSGHTGIGKTTLLSQLSLDYCMQGIVTMWGSFEIPSAKLAADMLTQMHGAMGGYGDLSTDFDSWADRLSQLPMFFMRYHGSNSVDTLLDAMEYGNYIYDCSHFLLDNLQFMTYGQGVRGAGRRSWRADRFEVMDEAVSSLRNMCTRDNVHVTLVVHPRKEGDNEPIQLASVFGSAKATQEADNVILLQRTKEGVAQLEIKKNRFDGQCGRINLRFDRQSKLFHESDKAACRMKMSLGEARLDPFVTVESNIDTEAIPKQNTAKRYVDTIFRSAKETIDENNSFKKIRFEDNSAPSGKKTNLTAANRKQMAKATVDEDEGSRGSFASMDEKKNATARKQVISNLIDFIEPVDEMKRGIISRRYVRHENDKGTDATNERHRDKDLRQWLRLQDND